MSWQDSYVKGSFRGVKFFSEASTQTVGHRRAIWDLPFDNKGAAGRDLGRRARRFRIKAILVGDNYDSAREKLIQAIEKEGEGELVHPWGGTFSVWTDGEITVEESTENGGMCIIEFTCVEGRGTQTLASPIDSVAQVKAKASTVRVAAKAVMTKNLLTQIRDFVKKANIKTLDKVVQDLRLLNSTVGAVLSVPSQTASQIDEISKQLKTLINSPGELFDSIDDANAKVISATVLVSGSGGNNVRAGSTTAAVLNSIELSSAALKSSVSAGGSLGSDPEPTSIAIKTAGGPGVQDPFKVQRLIPASQAGVRVQSGSTGSNSISTLRKITDDVAERQNHSVIKQSLRASALAACCEAIADAAFGSTKSAREMRDLVTSALQELVSHPIAGVETDDELALAISDLKSSVNTLINSLQLVDIVKYRHPAVESTLVIAYELYGDASRHEELEIRNSINHPLFVSQELDVATR